MSALRVQLLSPPLSPLASAGFSLKYAEFSEENLSLVMTAEGFDSPTRLQFTACGTAWCSRFPVTEEVQTGSNPVQVAIFARVSPNGMGLVFQTSA